MNGWHMGGMSGGFGMVFVIVLVMALLGLFVGQTLTGGAPA